MYYIYFTICNKFCLLIFNESLVHEVSSSLHTHFQIARYTTICLVVQDFYVEMACIQQYLL